MTVIKNKRILASILAMMAIASYGAIILKFYVD